MEPNPETINYPKVKYSHLYLSELQIKESKIHKKIDRSGDDHDYLLEMFSELKDTKQEIDDYEYLEMYLSDHENGCYDTQFVSISPRRVRIMNQLFSLLFGLTKTEKKTKKIIMNHLTLPISCKVLDFIGCSMKEYDVKYLKEIDYLSRISNTLFYCYHPEEYDVKKMFSKSRNSYDTINILDLYQWTKRKMIYIEVEMMDIFHENFHEESKYRNSDFYHFLMRKYPSQRLDSELSKEDFQNLFCKYMFFKTMEGTYHLCSNSEYRSSHTAFGESYIDEYEEDYEEHEEYYHRYEDEEDGYHCTYDDSTFRRYPRKNDNFFKCSYFIPDVVLDKFDIFMNKILSIPHLVDTLYQWSNWTYTLEKVQRFNKKLGGKVVLNDIQIRHHIQHPMREKDSEFDYMHIYVHWSGEKEISYNHPISFSNKMNCRITLYQPPDEPLKRRSQDFNIYQLLTIKKKDFFTEKNKFELNMRSKTLSSF